jgi:hypothetical protein
MQQPQADSPAEAAAAGAPERAAEQHRILQAHLRVSVRLTVAAIFLKLSRANSLIGCVVLCNNNNNNNNNNIWYVT